MSVKPSMMKHYLLSVLFAAVIPTIILGAVLIETAELSFQESTAAFQDYHRDNYRRDLKKYLNSVVGAIEAQRRERALLQLQNMQQQVARLYQFVEQRYLASGEPEVLLTVTDLSQSILLNGAMQAPMLLTVDAQLGLSTVDGKAYRGDGEGLFATAISHDERRAFLRRLQSEGEATLHFKVYRPSLQRVDEQQLTAKFFQPLSLIIVNSAWLSDLQQGIQQFIVENFASSGSASLFVLDERRKVIKSSFAMETFNRVRYTDKPAIKTTQQLQRYLLRTINKQHQPQFIQYSWFSSEGMELPSFSYLYYYPDWHWVIGVERSVSGLDTLMFAQQQKIETELKNTLQNILWLLFLLLVIFLSMVLWFYRRKVSAINQLAKKLESDRGQIEAIDTEPLPYKELVVLADAMNHTLIQHKNYEQALRRSRQRFRLALQASNSFMWEMDPASKSVTIDGNFFPLLGYSEKQNQAIALEYFLEICHPEDAEQLSVYFSGKHDELVEQGIEFRLKDASGYYRWFYNRGGMVDEEGVGRRTIWVGLLAEISAQKTMEMDLQKASEAVEDAQFSRAQFFSTMSHELHTPLNAVLGNAQLLKTYPNNSPEQAEHLRQIEEQGLHLLQKINDILALSRVDTQKNMLQQQPVKLSELIGSVLDVLRYKCRQKGIVFESLIDKKIPEILWLDEVKLKQLLINVLSHVVEYCDVQHIVLSVDYSYSENTQEKQLQFLIYDSLAEPSMSSSDEWQVLDKYINLSLANRLAMVLKGSLKLFNSASKRFSCYLELPVELSTNDSHYRMPKSVSLLPESREKTAECIDLEGLVDADRQAMIEAVQSGDIGRINTLLDNYAELSDEPFGWINHCRQLLLAFDLEGLMACLNPEDKQRVMS